MGEGRKERREEDRWDHGRRKKWRRTKVKRRDGVGGRGEVSREERSLRGIKEEVNEGEEQSKGMSKWKWRMKERVEEEPEVRRMAGRKNLKEREGGGEVSGKTKSIMMRVR